MTRGQFLGALLIVVSIGVAKTPDIIAVYQKATMNRDAVNSTVTDSPDSASAVNALPITAIFLAIFASCNSGQW